MILKTIVVGSIMENCYLAGDANELLVIDPGGDAEKILAEIEKNSYRVKYIVVTHCHSDHIGAVNAVKERTGAKIVLSEREKENYLDSNVNLMRGFGLNHQPEPPDVLLGDGAVISSGQYSFRAIQTPGHTSGGMCLLCGDVLFSGDTLFREGIGRCDLPTGNLKEIVRSIKERLFVLDDGVKVYPGHGPETTIGYEKQHNEVYEWERYCNEYDG